MPFFNGRHILPKRLSASTCAVVLLSVSIALHVTGAWAGDRDADWQMKEFAREQREQERQAAKMQHEQDRRAAQEQYDNKSSSSSSAFDKFNSSDSNDGNGFKKSGSSSTSDSSDKSDRKKQSSDDSKDTDDVIDDDTQPPRTVEKWLKRLAAPQPADLPNKAKPLTDNVATPATGVPKAALGKAPITATKAPAKLPTGGRPEPIQFPEVPLPEVLAVNATASTVARAKSLGFTTTPATSLASLDLSITRLLPPIGMSIGQAQALLQSSVPGANFAPNMKYRIYKTAAGIETKPQGVPPAPSAADGQPCAGDRCFAQTVIGWKPDLRKCAIGLKVGIIDTSIDTSHPTFAHKQIEVHHFGSKDKRGPDWHGTGVAALLAGDAQSASPGLIPDASFYVADIFYAGDDQSPASDTLSMLRAFNWLEAKGVKIINMSLSGPPDILIQEAIQKLAAKGIIMVAAAGNDGPNNAGPSYPAAYEDVIAVTAVNKNLQNYRYANRGSFVDISAPGVGIWTALPGAQNGYHSGTSFATPYVTASLAAIYPSLAGQKASVALQSLQFRDLGEAGDDPVYGRGLLVAPTSCRGGQIASAPVSLPPEKEQSSFFGLFAPTASSSQQVSPAGAEELPWLSLNAAKN